MDWARRLPVESVITFGVVAAAVLFVFVQLQPSLLFANTTPAGGDMGAHVWGPDYLRDTLLPNFRITGWAPDWYAGFPALHFYFPLPALLIVVFDLLLPYGVAFKLVTILGLVGLPVAAWAFGRLSGMRFPGPAVLAAATLPFLFDRGFTIYGGNIPSTLAGEFSFSISLSLALVFLGVVARALDTGKGRGLAAVLLALTGLCHVLPTIFSVVGALVLLLLRPDARRARLLVTVGAVGAALAAFWSVPFLFRLPYANNMGWEKLTEYSKNLFDLPSSNLTRPVLALAVLGALISLVFRRRTGLFLFAMAAISAAVFVLAPQGRLWNARVLPFWYLTLYMLAGLALAELGSALARLFSDRPEEPSVPITRATPVAVALVVWLFVGLPLGAVPKFVPIPRSADTSYIPAWAKWNYSGYERKAAYPEYEALVDTMAEVGRSTGCGRAHWEYESGLDRFGTPMALMLLPFWTDGCIASMEGLYFESSATVPYHFLSAAEVSKAPSNPMRDLPYRSLDLNAGIRHLQLLGTRYYMAFSPEATAQADVHPDLRLLAESGNWKIYEILGADLVTPLSFLPAVVTGMGGGERPWLDMSVNWYMDFSAHEVPLAASGPEEWPRVALREVTSTVKTVGSAVTVDSPLRRPVESNSVSNIRVSHDRISFDVDRPGQPVLVKMSYFPNWKASGADGPWRVTPNFMVVVPTSNHVELRYGYTPVDVGGWLLTFGGIAGVVLLRRQGALDLDEPTALVDADGDGGPPPGGPGGNGRARPLRQPVTARSRAT
jgi:hypothetical protein